MSFYRVALSSGVCAPQINSIVLLFYWLGSFVCENIIIIIIITTRLPCKRGEHTPVCSGSGWRFTPACSGSEWCSVRLCSRAHRAPYGTLRDVVEFPSDRRPCVAP